MDTNAAQQPRQMTGTSPKEVLVDIQTTVLVGTGTSAASAVEEAIFVASRIAAGRGLRVISTETISAGLFQPTGWFRAEVRVTFAVA